jgi:hypothetical protein
MTTSFKSYVSASRYLRSAIALNRSDEDFWTHNGEIIYLFDTNIVESYLRADYAIVGSPFRAGEIFTAKAAEVSGRLTLKYLFSGELPGQRGPAFLSTPHWNEALGRADRVAAFAQDNLRRVDPGALSALAEAYPMLHALKDAPADLLKRAEEMKLGEALLALAKTASTELRLKDAFVGTGPDRSRPPMVMDLERCDAYWPAAVNAVRRSDFRSWQARLSEARRRGTPARRPGRDGVLPNNIDHDAMTIAAIQAMYRENPEAGGSNPTVRFVFVSADRAIEIALTEGEQHLTNEGIPYFLRHPRVYMPLLNFSGMNRTILKDSTEYAAVRQVFDEVERAVRALFPFDYARSATRLSADWDLQPNINRWSSAAERLVLVNARYFLSDIDETSAVIGQVSKMLEQGDVLAAAADSMSGTLRTIRSEHTEQMAVLALDRLVATHRRSRAGRQNVAQRAPLKPLDVDLLAIVRPVFPATRSDLETLEDLLNRIRTDGGGKDGLLNQVVQRLNSALKGHAPGTQAIGSPPSSNPAAAVRLLASAIYFALGAWDSARLCAELCLNSLHKGERFGAWAREANYFMALALRMTLRSTDEVNSARRFLNYNIGRGDQTSLAYVRDLVEHSTLMMTATVVQAIENATPNQPMGSGGGLIHLVENREIALEFDAAVLGLGRALEMVEGFERTQSYVASRIRMQANVNLLGAAIFGQILRGELTEDNYTLERISAAAQSVHDDLAEFRISPVPLSAQLYLAVAELMLRPSEPSAAEVGKILAQIERSSALVSNADRVEHTFLNQRLKLSTIQLETIGSPAATLVAAGEP